MRIQEVCPENRATQHANPTLLVPISTFQPLELRAIQFTILLIGYLVYGVLLQQPKQTKIGCEDFNILQLNLYQI